MSLVTGSAREYLVADYTICFLICCCFLVLASVTSGRFYTSWWSLAQLGYPCPRVHQNHPSQGWSPGWQRPQPLLPFNTSILTSNLFTYVQLLLSPFFCIFPHLFLPSPIWSFPSCVFGPSLEHPIVSLANPKMFFPTSHSESPAPVGSNSLRDCNWIDGELMGSVFHWLSWGYPCNQWGWWLPWASPGSNPVSGSASSGAATGVPLPVIVPLLLCVHGDEPSVT